MYNIKVMLEFRVSSTTFNFLVKKIKDDCNFVFPVITKSVTFFTVRTRK